MGTRMLTVITAVIYVLGWLPGAACRAGEWLIATLETGFTEGRHGRQEVTE